MKAVTKRDEVRVEQTAIQGRSDDRGFLAGVEIQATSMRRRSLVTILGVVGKVRCRFDPVLGRLLVVHGMLRFGSRAMTRYRLIGLREQRLQNFGSQAITNFRP